MSAFQGVTRNRFWWVFVGVPSAILVGIFAAHIDLSSLFSTPDKPPITPAKPDIVVHTLRDVDPHLLVHITSHDHRELQVRGLVINGNHSPDCTWPSKSKSDSPHIYGNIDGPPHVYAIAQGRSVDFYQAPVYLGLGGGGDFVGFTNCGEPVEVEIQTDAGSFSYPVTAPP